MKKSSVLLVYTGGTIGMKTDPRTGSLKAFDFNNIYEEFPYLKILPVDIDFINLKPIDSSNVTMALWVHLAELVRDNYDRFDGFVIMHGTDTMAYSASALSFMFKNLAKPVIFTGSQLPIGVMRTDGRENLISAIEIAAAKNEFHEAMVPEVCIYFNNKLFRGNRCQKRSVEQMSAFASANYPPLAEVGIKINYAIANIRRRKLEYPLEISTLLDNSIIVVKIFPGMTDSVFKAMLGAPGVKAVVLETYGAGNAPSFAWFVDALEEAISRGIIIVNVTQCYRGSVSMSLYSVGLRILQLGVVSCYDITVEAAVAKLMYLLGKGFSRERIIGLMTVPLRGEFTDPTDTGVGF